MPRNLNPRFQQHIARARRTRIMGGALLVTCLLVGTGAALTQTQLPYQVATTLKPITTEFGNSLSQFPSALSQRIPKFDPQLPAAASQLAASATSFQQSVAENVRNLFCRWLGCARELAATSTPRILNEDLSDIGNQQRATLPPNVKQPASIPSPTGDATTTIQVVASNFPASAYGSAPQQQVTQSRSSNARTQSSNPASPKRSSTRNSLNPGNSSDAQLSRLVAQTSALQPNADISSPRADRRF